VRVTFVDAGLLIAVAQGKDDVYEEALAVLDNPEREFVSSVYVKLEVLPNAVYMELDDQVEVYQEFFDNVYRWVLSSPELSDRALELARAHGLGALDALHAAAAEVEAAELVTTEKTTKPMFRVTSIEVTSIRK